MPTLGQTNSTTEITANNQSDSQALLATLPVYASLALATAGGITSGQAFVLSGVVLGLETFKLVVIKP